MYSTCGAVQYTEVGYLVEEKKIKLNSLLVVIKLEELIANLFM